jgi:uncharacterized protein YndB with AHSA1/START domain
MTISDNQIEKVKIISNPVEELWLQWTTHEGLKTFFGYDNKIDLTPGGAFEIYFIKENPYGLKGSEGCKVLSYLPEQMLSFSWNAPPNFTNVRNSAYQTWVVVNFITLTASTTKVTLIHTGWPDDEKWDAVFDYFDKAWDRVLESLAQTSMIR